MQKQNKTGKTAAIVIFGTIAATLGTILMSGLMILLVFMFFGFRPTSISDITDMFKGESYEEYVFNIDDIKKLSDNDEDTIEYYTKLIELQDVRGEETNILYDEDKCVEASIIGYDCEFIVGEDVVPGIYTINLDDDQLVSTSAVFYTSNGKYINVPLFEGETISVAFMDDDEGKDSGLWLHPQEEYLPYDGTHSGFFIFGISYDDEIIKIKRREYSYCKVRTLSDGGFYTMEYYESENVKIENVPGTTISIDREQN